MTIPTMDELRGKVLLQNEPMHPSYAIEVAFYHGANSMLDVLHKSFGDNPEIAAFIKLLTDELNADMAATIGG